MSKSEGSRFKLVDSPVLAPGVDIVTKTSRGPFIDTGYELQFMEWKTGSRIYLSVDTIREMADVAGLFDVEESSLQEMLDAAYTKGHQEGLTETIDEDVRNAVDRLGYYADILGTAVRDVPAVVPVEVDAENAGAADGIVDTPKPKRKRATRTPRQGDSPAVEQGRADVPAVAVDESLLGV